jgi:hypothetical protein
MRGRVVKADDSADHRGPRAPAAVAENLVAIAHRLARHIEEVGGDRAGLADQPVSIAVWHQGEIAGSQ